MVCLRRAAPQTSRTPPNLDHMVLEWDPSVDIGGPVSQSNADLSYFSANTDREKPLARDGVKRRSYLSYIGSQSDINDRAAEKMCTGCSEGSHSLRYIPVQTRPQELCLTPYTLQSCDLQLKSDRMACRLQLNPQSPEEDTHCNASWEVVHSEQRPDDCPNRQTQFRFWPLGAVWVLKTLRSPVFLVVLLAVFLALLVLPIALLMDPECHRSNSLALSFQLALSYVNGPPPTRGTKVSQRGHNTPLVSLEHT